MYIAAVGGSHHWRIAPLQIKKDPYLGSPERLKKLVVLPILLQFILVKPIGCVITFQGKWDIY